MTWCCALDWPTWLSRETPTTTNAGLRFYLDQRTARIVQTNRGWIR